MALRSDGEWLRVSDIEDVWKIRDEWWRGDEKEIERVYFALVLENGQRVTLFQDLKRRQWYRQAD